MPSANIGLYQTLPGNVFIYTVVDWWRFVVSAGLIEGMGVRFNRALLSGEQGAFFQVGCTEETVNEVVGSTKMGQPIMRPKISVHPLRRIAAGPTNAFQAEATWFVIAPPGPPLPPPDKLCVTHTFVVAGVNIPNVVISPLLKLEDIPYKARFPY